MQVNLEYLARVVFKSKSNILYPDSVVGTDSHTTMIDGLGVAGWGVGGIEAEAAMLGQVRLCSPDSIKSMHCSGSASKEHRVVACLRGAQFWLRARLISSFLAPSLPLQPMSMVLPRVVGFKLTGRLNPGVTATDLVLTCTQMLRAHGVVGKFVEFYGACPLLHLSREL